MPSRAHCLWQFNEGTTFIPAATISVYDPGTTNLISDTIYANDDPDVSVLPNPFTSDASGFASFFLEDARRVDLHMAKTGFTSQTIPSLDVTFPANRFTFQGAYSALTAYEPDDVVTYNGATWINLTAATGTAPVEGATWSKMAAAGDVNSTLIDAKGDLIVGTAADTVGRLAVGAEGTIPVSRAAEAGGIGWETFVSQRAFDGAKVYRASAASQSIPNATDTVVTGWNTETFDSGTYWDAAAPERFTVPRAGKYRIEAQGDWTANQEGYRQFKVLKNGVTNLGLRRIATNMGTTGYGLDGHVSVIANLAATDYVSLSAYQNSGGALALWLHADTFFQIEYLGS